MGIAPDFVAGSMSKRLMDHSANTILWSGILGTMAEWLSRGTRIGCILE